MAKSEGNIFLLHEALAAFGRDALIMYFSAGHYRQPVEFDPERMDQAAANVRRVREVARRLVPGPSPGWSAALRDEFFTALAQDFNTPRALAAVFEWIGQANRAEALAILQEATKTEPRFAERTYELQVERVKMWSRDAEISPAAIEGTLKVLADDLVDR